MKTFLKVFFVVFFLAIIFIILWAFIPANFEESLAANVKVVTDPVEIKSPGKEWVKVKSLGSLAPGASLRVGKGGLAFIGYFDGGLSRIEGPTELNLEESRRDIEGQSFLGGMVVKLLGKEPTGKTQVKSSLVLDVISGEVISRKGKPPSLDSVVKVKGPQTSAIATGASFRMGVDPGKGSWWESLDGNTTLGMVSVQGTIAAPLVIPQLAPGTRILVPEIPGEFQASPKIQELKTGVEKALPVLRGALASTRVNGTEYLLFSEDPRLPYFLGPEVALAPKPPAPVVQKPQKAATAPVPKGAFDVPGAKREVFTEKDITPHLPAGTGVRFVPGNVVEVTYKGAVYQVRLNVTRGKVDIRGLPLGVDPWPYIEQYVEEVPVVLSLETEDGALAVTYLPDEPLVEQEKEAAEAEPPPLPRTSPYFVSIPSPEEVSTDWRVIATNGVFVAYAAIIIRILVSVINSIFKTQEERVGHLVSRLGRFGDALARVPRAIFSALSHIPLYGLFRVLALLLVSGLIYSFLDQRFKPLAGKGLGILPLMTFSMALVLLLEPIARSIILSRWKVPHSLGVYPTSLLLAVVSVGVSRGFSFSPGFLLGIPGGLKVSGLKEGQKFTLALVATGAVVGTGLVAWGIALVLPKLTGPEGVIYLQALKGPLAFLRDIFLTIFAAAITRAFFFLIPFPGSNGAVLWAKNKLSWVALFCITAFTFLHALGNKGSSFNNLMAEHGPLVFSLIGVSLFLALSLWLLSRLLPRKAPA